MNGRGTAKLTAERVREIRALYAEGDVTLKELGRRFGISETHASRIVRRLFWAHVA